MASDILSEFNSNDVSHFKKDAMQMVKVGIEIDRYYGEGHHDLDAFIPKYEKLIQLFNKKYKGIAIKTKKTSDSFRTRLFAKSKDIKEFFAESASKIQGLRAIGKTGFNQADSSNTEAFVALIESLADFLFVSYADPDRGTSTLAVFYDKKEKMAEINYNPEDMMNENSASFKVFAYYALKSGIDRKIDILAEASTF
ncbi:MAG: hypothetical protein AABX00_00435 [Nanoarchaeota archaeon]